jgi:flagellar biosynthesis anti-sigma factor FlgM
MRIDSNLPANLMIEAGRTTKTTQSPTGSTVNDDSSDRARLSIDQSTIKSLEANLAQVPDVRREKVDALRSAIKDGSYSVSPEQIAGAMYREIMSQASGE